MGKFPTLEVLFITFVTAVVSYFNVFTHAGGPELIANLFAVSDLSPLTFRTDLLTFVH